MKLFFVQQHYIPVDNYGHGHDDAHQDAGADDDEEEGEEILAQVESRINDKRMNITGRLITVVLFPIIGW